MMFVDKVKKLQLKPLETGDTARTRTPKTEAAASLAGDRSLWDLSKISSDHPKKGSQIAK